MFARAPFVLTSIKRNVFHTLRYLPDALASFYEFCNSGGVRGCIPVTVRRFLSAFEEPQMPISDKGKVTDTPANRKLSLRGKQSDDSRVRRTSDVNEGGSASFAKLLHPPPPPSPAFPPSFRAWTNKCTGGTVFIHHRLICGVFRE